MCAPERGAARLQAGRHREVHAASSFASTKWTGGPLGPRDARGSREGQEAAGSDEAQPRLDRG